MTILSLLLEIKPGDGREIRALVRMIGIAFIIVAVVTLALVTSSKKGRVPRAFGFRELVIFLGCWLVLIGLLRITLFAVFYFRDFTDPFRFFERLAFWEPMSLVLAIVGTLIAALGLRMPTRAPGEEVESDIRSMTVGFALTFVGISVVMTLLPWGISPAYPFFFLLSMFGFALLLLGILIICVNLLRRTRKDPWSDH